MEDDERHIFRAGDYKFERTGSLVVVTLIITAAAAAAAGRRRRRRRRTRRKVADSIRSRQITT